MKGRLFTIASAISLLLFVATVVLWVRSYFISDELFYECQSDDRVDGWKYEVQFNCGEVFASRLVDHDSIQHRRAFEVQLAQSLKRAGARTLPADHCFAASVGARGIRASRLSGVVDVSIPTSWGLGSTRLLGHRRAIL